MRMLVEGEWRAHQPFAGTAGFHISALYSPWQKFSDVVQEFLDKKDHPETMKTFVNLQLGECWEDRSGETVDHAALMARRESWDINAIPDDVVLITAGIDTQDDRLECTLLGWTGMEQARVLDHLQLWGNPGDATVWTELDAILQAQYQTDMGRLLRVRAACIDSGGSHTQRVYEFCRSRANRKVFPIKGRPGSHPLWPNKVSRSKLSNGVQLYLIGVDTGKDMMRSAFGVSNPDRPRYVSFAADLPDAYFVQLVSEKRHTGTNKAGFPVVTWRKPQGVRNEALDCFNYAQAALEALKASGVRLKAVAQNVAAKTASRQASHSRGSDAGSQPRASADASHT
jgi:phage terminase large subunit GpA-like protein